jgi:hypothetical protein
MHESNENRGKGKMHERNVSAVAKLRKEKPQNHRKEIGGEVWNIEICSTGIAKRMINKRKCSDKSKERRNTEIIVRGLSLVLVINNSAITNTCFVEIK